MTRLTFAVAVLALGFAATTPARGDFAVVKWQDGYCGIWWDSAATPWVAGWTKIAVAPDWEAAWHAQDAAIHSGACK
jgi:hypothetical protein